MGSIDTLPKGKGRVEPIFPGKIGITKKGHIFTYCVPCSAVALGLVLATLAKPPFNNMFITFSATPELLTIPPGGLVDQARWMVRTDWGMNTDYEAVFLKLILPSAVQNNVKVCLVAIRI
jgi:hypothetical protein